MSKSHKGTHTSCGTLREKHIDAFARTRGCLCLRYSCNFGSNDTKLTNLVVEFQVHINYIKLKSNLCKLKLMLQYNLMLQRMIFVEMTIE